MHNTQIGVWAAIYCDEHYLWAQQNQKDLILNESEVSWIIQDSVSPVKEG